MDNTNDIDNFLLLLKKLKNLNDLETIFTVIDFLYLYDKNKFKFLSKLKLLNNFIIVKNILTTISFYPKENWEDALSQSQIKSKLWLIDELKKLNLKFDLVYNLASWYNILALFLSEYLNVKKVKSFDKDPNVLNVSDRMIHHRLIDNFNYKTTIMDIFDINYSCHNYKTTRCQLDGIIKEFEITNESPDLIINCSCEHLNYEKWLQLIPKDKIVILQNNNAFNFSDHINCVNNLQEFVTKCDLSEIYYQGTLHLQNYDRFMIIGTT